MAQKESESELVMRLQRSVVALPVIACCAFLSSSPGQAATVDLLASDPNLAIYLKDFPTGLTETAVNLNDQSNVQTTDGTAGSTTVRFVSSGFFDAASGHATITGVGGNTTYPNLTISTLGFTFTDLTFGAQTPTANDLTVTAYDGATVLGTYTFSGTDGFKANAKNDILILAEGGSLITSVVIESSDGLNQTKDFHLSGLQSVTGGGGLGETPLPGALALMGTVLAGGAGFGAWRRRYKSRK